MKTLTKIILKFAGLCVLCLVLVLVLTWNYAYEAGWQDCYNKIILDYDIGPMDWQPIPTQREIQQILVDAGYDIGPKGIDGVIGKDTRTALDKAECQRMAMPTMRAFAKATREQ